MPLDLPPPRTGPDPDDPDLGNDTTTPLPPTPGQLAEDVDDDADG